MENPYTNQLPKAFWRLAVADRQPMEIADLWAPKFEIPKDRPIATLGSCFAQHISRALVVAGYTWLNSEPAPYKFPEEYKADFNYDVFSARIGNVYSTALLKQWVHWALGARAPDAEIWETNGRFYDPFRPAIQPNGFSSPAEVLATRTKTIESIRRMFESCHTFIFTLGLTEVWRNIERDTVYPMCPGTVAGVFDPHHHEFKNYRYHEIFSDLNEAIEIVKEHNPKINVLLTVSPVPLTATATPQHVLVATMYSKSTLRAVAGDMAVLRQDTDYFPSFEIISSPPFKGAFYESNMRTVSKKGVDFVMKYFITQLETDQNCSQLDPEVDIACEPNDNYGAAEKQAAMEVDNSDCCFVDEICEDMLLDAFAKKK